MTSALRYAKTADRPAAEMWLYDDDGTLINFASGYTFSFKIGNPGSAALLTKTTGIVGAAGSGTEPDGTPNITITWAAGELDIAPGSYAWQLTATSSALGRVFQGAVQITAVIT